jgi:cyclophilin family peptidyl-prolyl cis-trans isomerase
MMLRRALLLPFLSLACQRTPLVAPPKPPHAAVVQPSVALPWAATQTEPHAAEPLGQVVAKLRQQATPEGMAQIAPLLTATSVDRLRQPNGALAILPVTLQSQLAGPFDRVQLDGGRAALIAAKKGFSRTAWFFLQDGHWRLDAANTATWHAADPGPPDPQNHAISLADAVTEIAGQGALYAVLTTTQGVVHCLLLQQEVPELVAHFVGLARGKRAWRAADGAWQHKPLYDDLPFQRAQPGIWAITGDPTQKGPGGAGFHIADVLRLNLRHDKPGMLSFVTLGQANTASSQIALFAKAAPWADDQHLPFGICQELDVIEKLSQQPPRSQRLLRVTFQRGM